MRFSLSANSNQTERRTDTIYLVHMGKPNHLLEDTPKKQQKAPKRLYSIHSPAYLIKNRPMKQRYFKNH